MPHCRHDRLDSDNDQRPFVNPERKTVEAYRMASERANPSTLDINQEIKDLLCEIDSASQTQRDRWAEKRNNDRRVFQTQCLVHYPAPDATSILVLRAASRDFSTSGMGYVSNTHFHRRTPILLAVRLQDGKIKYLTGVVVYCRCVREGWYLTGVNFGPVSDERLRPELCTASFEEDEDGSLGAKGRGGASQSEPPNTPTKRDRALAVLASAGTARVMTKRMITKVVALTASRDKVVRRATIPVLMQMPRQDGVLAIIQMLHDANAAVACDAIEAIGKLNAKEAVAPLKDLLKHKDDEVALRAAETLGSFDDRTGLPLAVRILKSDAPLNRRAARSVGVILGQVFRPTTEGVAAARRYLKSKKIK